MKLKIKRDILLENLNNVSKALSSRNIIPVLNGIMFDLKEEGLYLTATDNDITIRSFIEKKDIKEIEEEGTIVIYGRFILDIVRKLTNDIIEIEESDGNKAIISTSSSKYNLNCFEVTDFPKIKLEENENEINLSTITLKNIINKTAFATSTQESRPLLTGINLKIVGDLLECVSTDSYRLAKIVIKMDKIIEENVNVIIPARNILDFIKIIENEEEDINLYVFSNKLLFKYKNLYFQSSLLNGSYPNTDSLIPTNFEMELEVNVRDFYDVIDRASLLNQSKEKNIIQLENKGNKVKITSSSLEIGKVEEKMALISKTGDDITISFSSKYILDALKTFDEENIKILLNGEIKPIILQGVTNKDLTQLILPIKTY